MEVEALAVTDSTDPSPLLRRLARALAGGAPVGLHRPDTTDPLPPYRAEDLPADLAVVVGTSGSGGDAKHALLGTAALTASARATHERLGGPGRWLLALSPAHVAGLQVLVRSLEAGTAPVVLDPAAPSSTDAFAHATARLGDGGRRYTALVPTQLLRLLEHPAGADALRGFDAVLVGGAALPPALRRRADDAGVRLVATYGMSETAGGCVYDGVPLAGSRARVGDDGRIHLTGPTLAHGYLGRPDLTAAAFATADDDARWFRTDDAGALTTDGRLHVHGRLDDVVVTGGLKVAPRTVEEAVVEHVPGVREVVVVGVPDPQWGQAVAAYLVMADGRPAPTVDEVRAALRPALPAHALPRRVRTGPWIPLRGPGKPDRRAVAARFAVGG